MPAAVLNIRGEFKPATQVPIAGGALPLEGIGNAPPVLFSETIQEVAGCIPVFREMHPVDDCDALRFLDLARMDA